MRKTPVVGVLGTLFLIASNSVLPQLPALGD
jgi:hypothetical protein